MTTLSCEKETQTLSGTKDTQLCKLEINFSDAGIVPAIETGA